MPDSYTPQGNPATDDVVRAIAVALRGLPHDASREDAERRLQVVLDVTDDDDVVARAAVKTTLDMWPQARPDMWPVERLRAKRTAE